jgi:hypothetical protein
MGGEIRSIAFRLMTSLRRPTVKSLSLTYSGGREALVASELGIFSRNRIATGFERQFANRPLFRSVGKLGIRRSHDGFFMRHSDGS